MRGGKKTDLGPPGRLAKAPFFGRGAARFCGGFWGPAQKSRRIRGKVLGSSSYKKKTPARGNLVTGGVVFCGGRGRSNFKPAVKKGPGHSPPGGPGRFGAGKGAGSRIGPKRSSPTASRTTVICRCSAAGWRKRGLRPLLAPKNRGSWADGRGHFIGQTRATRARGGSRACIGAGGRRLKSVGHPAGELLGSADSVLCQKGVFAIPKGEDRDFGVFFNGGTGEAICGAGIGWKLPLLWGAVFPESKKG